MVYLNFICFSKSFLNDEEKDLVMVYLNFILYSKGFLNAEEKDLIMA
jgi:hypothetical protein